MTQKIDIVEQLGERSLVLPELIARGLAANDRAKYYMALLLACRDHADASPGAEAADLRSDRIAVGEDDPTLDALAARSRRDADGNVVVPAVAEVHARLLASIDEMLAPVGVGDGPSPRAGEAFETRLEALRSSSAPDGDHLPPSYFDRVSRAERAGGDSLHLLVMDLHKALNRMQAELYAESIDGASTYGLRDEDRALVQAFMRGVNATSALKLAHPGLGTTATRSGNRLVIQNDIGTTDAHVLVAHVDGLELSITYTDIHVPRGQFFQELFTPLGAVWTVRASGGAGGYETRGGRLVAGSREELERNLAFLGSRLVFLIDWNRARKRLSRFVGKGDAVGILRWAAEHDIGHRAFLEAGGERLISRALERIPGVHLPYGARLDEVVGADLARGFLMSVLRITSEGFANGRSLRLIRDEVEAELIELFHQAEQGAITHVTDHAALVGAIAGSLRDALLRAATAADATSVTQAAERAKRWETRADEIVRAARGASRQSAGASAVARLLAEADDVADGLEEATFRLTLLQQRGCGAASLGALQELADLAVRGAQSWVRSVEIARDVQHGGGRDDVQDFLVAVDQLVTIEHDSDAAERRAQTVFLDHAADFRELHLLSRLASTLEQATDSLARCGLMLKDHVLGDLMAEA